MGKLLYIKKSGNILFFLIVSTMFAFGEDINQRTITNPLELNYRFSKIHNEKPRREAADPEIVLYKDKYYLFASKSGGYWSSNNLVNWQYIKCDTLPIENYAPTAAVINDELFFFASGADRFFKTKSPESGIWEAVENKTDVRETDPDIFVDEDGKVYLYWGCSDKDPIMGALVDPKNGFKIIGQRKALVSHNYSENGWEKPGNNNEMDKRGWNEGANMIKYKGKYYLQYAAPGTQFRLYADGVYVSDSPLGEFKYEKYSPFSIKSGGFIGSAGHGATFKDKFGNYWHIASMLVGVRHGFERRLGLFPTYFDKDNQIITITEATDRPFVIPNKKVDFSKQNISRNWNILSYKKNASASSEFEGFTADKALDEQIETWWCAQTGNIGESLQVDLNSICEIFAIQVNFADEGFDGYAEDPAPVYKYIIEVSDDAKNWNLVLDKTKNTASIPHEFSILKQPKKARFVRIKNMGNLNAKFSISGFRIFGTSFEKIPSKVENFKALRDKDDTRNIELTWDKVNGATGYKLSYGIQRDKLHTQRTIYDSTSIKGSFLNKGVPYFFKIEPFNGAGYGRASYTDVK